MRRVLLGLAALATLLAVAACGRPTPRGRLMGGCGPILLAKHRYGCAPSGASGAPVMTPNVYVAQTAAGSGSGASCGNAESVATLNANTNSEWTGGNVIGLCGTITSTITAAGSGTSSSPVSIYFEPGANMTMSEANCLNGCVNLSNQNYITLNGGQDGVIQVTDNGDELANQASINGVNVGSTDHVTVEYLTIENMYVKHQNTQFDAVASGISDTNASNLVIDHNTLTQDGGSGVWVYNTAATVGSITISNNDLSLENWTVGISAGANDTIGPVYIFGNHFHDIYNWDDPQDNNHHNGIHCYTGGANGYTPHYNGFYVYNNLFDGNTGANATAWFFVENCSDETTTYWNFNNIFVGGGNNGASAIEKGVVNDYNDTYLGGGIGSYWAYDGTINYHNNLNENGGTGFIDASGFGGTLTLAGASNNLYANTLGGSTTTFYCPYSSGNTWSSGWSAWQSCSGDTSSFGAPGSSQTVTDPGLNSNDAPTTGSPALSAGENLYSTCNGQPNPGLGALCDTYAGPLPSGTGAGVNGQWATPASRPSTGAWNVGAY